MTGLMLWLMLIMLPMSYPYAALTGVHDPKNELILYIDRPDLSAPCAVDDRAARSFMRREVASPVTPGANASLFGVQDRHLGYSTPPSIWEQSPSCVIASGLLAAVGGTLISGLLVQRKQRQRAEQALRASGGEGWYTMAVKALRRAEGGAVISHRDTSDRKRTELTVQRYYRELAHMARVAIMGELAASLAQELTQPLTAILSNAQAAQRFLTADPQALDGVQAILADVVEDDQRAGEVIRRLRILLSKGEVERLPLNANEMVQEVVKLLHSDATLRHMSIVRDLEPDLPPVRGDRVQLQQVLLNLMLNSFDAMADRPLGDRHMVVRTQRVDALTIQIAVQDHGSGIEAGLLERVFEPFYTTKPEGLGMGLSICRSLIEGHHGRIWAVNNPDEGATFCFTLPVEDQGG
jgi:C4-dicarboxylate-specific signal transduction histidine kinase